MRFPLAPRQKLVNFVGRPRGDIDSGAHDPLFVQYVEVEMSSKESAKSKKMEFDIDTGQRKAVEAYIEAYNSDPHRLTRKIRFADIVNQALAAYLRKAAEGHENGKKQS